jgi:tRNA threonylcarbamoyladenosine biosynthesis protein TsaB
VDSNNSYLLHIETATNVCSVALSRNGEYLHHLTEEGTMQHAKIITVMIGQLLKETNLAIENLSAVALSEGPGSYTSLRVGMSVAKGICYGLDLPLIAVNTLEAIALEARRQEPGADLISAMIDARRMEVYASLYDRRMQRLIDNQPIILDANSFDEYLGTGKIIVLCGNGAEKMKPVITDKNVRFGVEKTDSRYLIEPAYAYFQQKEYADLAYFSPNYIKSPNITQARKRLL